VPNPPFASETGKARADGSASSFVLSAALIEPAAAPLAGDTASGFPLVPSPVMGEVTLTLLSPLAAAFALGSIPLSSLMPYRVASAQAATLSIGPPVQAAQVAP
jgi:hypothetical protein